MLKDPFLVSLFALGFALMLLGGCTSPDPTWGQVTKELQQRYGQGR